MFRCPKASRNLLMTIRNPQQVGLTDGKTPGNAGVGAVIGSIAPRLEIGLLAVDFGRSVNNYRASANKFNCKGRQKDFYLSVSHPGDVTRRSFGL